jgi:CPA2 family monovalent cation:H+ antiporter-2
MLSPLIFHGVGLLQRRLGAAVPEEARFYGQKRYGALERELEVIKARHEERTRAESLRLQHLLERFPILQLVEQRDQEALLLLFRPKSASPGEKVIRHGDRADGMYFISSGAVEVKVNGRSIPLAPGDFFGEMALLSGGRRNGDVVAVDFCQFQVLERRDFNLFTARHPALRSAITSVAEERRTMNLAPPVDGTSTGQRPA